MTTPLPTDPEARAAELKSRLSPLEFDVTQHQGTERAFTGRYWDTHDDGTYHCVVCDAPLFSSATKYESHSGWPSFWQPFDDDSVKLHSDTSHGMTRTEVVCANCDAHLGHLFDDGPRPTGERYCMNSAALNLRTDGDTEGNTST